MAEPAFTPGPWEMIHRPESGDFYVCYDNDEGYGPSLLEGGLVLADDKRNAANARLIAAAPALYEALVAVLPVLEAQADDASCDYGAFIQEGGGVPPVAMQVKMDTVYDRLSLARAALSLALGEKQDA